MTCLFTSTIYIQCLQVLRASATKPFLEVAKELCLEAIMLGSADNVTAQVVDLSKELYKPEVKEEIK